MKPATVQIQGHYVWALHLVLSASFGFFVACSISPLALSYDRECGTIAGAIAQSFYVCCLRDFRKHQVVIVCSLLISGFIPPFISDPPHLVRILSLVLAPLIGGVIVAVGYSQQGQLPIKPKPPPSQSPTEIDPAE